MAYERNFTKDDDLFVGDDIRLEFEVFDDDLVVNDDGEYVSGTPLDVSGWSLSFAVRRGDTATGTPQISKATGGDGITITGTFDAVRADNTQRVAVAIADTDTFSDAGVVLVSPSTYRYSLKRTNAGSEKTIAFGKFVLRMAPVRA